MIKQIKALLSSSIACILIAVLIIPVEAANEPDADIPYLINYQGNLSDHDSGLPLTGTVSLTFSLFPLETDGKASWTETHPSVVLNSGIFNVILGSVTPLDPGTGLAEESWLEIQIKDEKLTPRQRLTATAYTLFADNTNNANKLDGMDSNDFLPVAGGIITGVLTLPENGLTVAGEQLVLTNGRVGIGVSDPAEKLTVGGVIESASGGYKFPDGTVQTTATIPSIRDKILILSELLGQLEFGAHFPTNAMNSLACYSNPTSASFSFSIGGSPVGEVIGFMGEDRISETYSYYVAVRTTSAGINVANVVGKYGVLTYQGATNFTGMITEFEIAAFDGTNAIFVARLEPAFATLRWSRGYGPTYVDSSLGDIVDEVLSSAGLIANIHNGDSSGPFKWEGRYNESTTDFVNRLLERDGFHYHFVSNLADETMIIGNSNSTFTSTGNTLHYYGHLNNPGTGDEFVSTFSHKSALYLGSSVGTGWDYINKQRLSDSAVSAGGIGENVEFRSDVTSSNIATLRAQVNLERGLISKHQYTGTSNAGSIKAGHMFSLMDDSGAGLSGSYLITGVRHLALYDDTALCFTYCNAFTAIPSTVTFRPEQKTPLPRAPGIYTAVVTENNNDPDGLGRVKVRIHGDVNFESAWARVIGTEGHKNMTTGTPAEQGEIIRETTFTHPVDSEVFVAFHQGNPALPLVLGSVHNGVDIPPEPQECVLSFNPDGMSITTIAGDNFIGNIDINAAGSLNLSGTDLNMESDTTMRTQAATTMEIEAGGDMDIAAGGDLKTGSTGTMDLQGALIKLNNGSKPAARVGDTVNTPPLGSTGTIISGSSTVRIGD